MNVMFDILIFSRDHESMPGKAVRHLQVGSCVAIHDPPGIR